VLVAHRTAKGQGRGYTDDCQQVCRTALCTRSVKRERENGGIGDSDESIPEEQTCPRLTGSTVMELMLCMFRISSFIPLPPSSYTHVFCSNYVFQFHGGSCDICVDKFSCSCVAGVWHCLQASLSCAAGSCKPTHDAPVPTHPTTDPTPSPHRQTPAQHDATFYPYLALKQSTRVGLGPMQTNGRIIRYLFK
jgi:hypothetical protein